MNRSVFGLLMIAFLALPSHVHSQSKPPITIKDMTRHNGINETFSITEQTAARIPEWNPINTETPPLSISKAVAIARQWMKKQRPKENKPDLESVTIERVRWSGLDNRWYYVVELNRDFKGMNSAGVPGDIRLGDSAFIVILMDGTTVDPIITKRQLR